MSVVTTYPFDTPGNYTAVNAVVSGGQGVLDFVDLESQSFNEDFADDTGFTYNGDNHEFSGGQIQQKHQYTNAVFHASFTNGKDGDWGDGTLTGTLVGTAAVAGGVLDLRNGTNSCITYPAGSHVDALDQEGSIAVRITPDYNGSPSGTQYFFDSAGNLGHNRIVVQHTSGGNLDVRVADETGAWILNSTYAWSPVSGTTYEFLLCFDATAGTNSFYIDRTRVISSSSTGTRGGGNQPTTFVIGCIYNLASGVSDFTCDSIMMWSTCIETGASYATNKLDGSLQYPYTNNSATLPEFEYTGIGNLVALTGFSTTETGSPRYTLQLDQSGDYLYWNGSAWAVSDGTYAQANSAADINTNIGALSVSGDTYLQVKITFNDSLTQMSVGDLTVNYTGQQYDDEGTILTNSGFTANEITAMTASSTTPAGTSIKYIMNLNGTDYYHNGSSWTTSDGTSSQANTLAEVQAALSSLLSANSTVKIKTVLISDQTDTPIIDLLTLTYDFGGLEPAAPTQCQVYGYLTDAEENPISGANIVMQPDRASKEYVEAGSRIIGSTVSKTTDSNGYFSANLISSSEYDVSGGSNTTVKYKLTITLSNGTQYKTKDGGDITFTVPDSASVNITDQIGAA